MGYRLSKNGILLSTQRFSGLSGLLSPVLRRIFVRIAELNDNRCVSALLGGGRSVCVTAVKSLFQQENAGRAALLFQTVAHLVQHAFYREHKCAFYACLSLFAILFALTISGFKQADKCLFTDTQVAAKAGDSYLLAHLIAQGKVGVAAIDELLGRKGFLKIDALAILCDFGALSAPAFAVAVPSVHASTAFRKSFVLS